MFPLSFLPPLLPFTLPLPNPALSFLLPLLFMYQPRHQTPSALSHPQAQASQLVVHPSSANRCPMMMTKTTTMSGSPSHRHHANDDDARHQTTTGPQHVRRHWYVHSVMSYGALTHSCSSLSHPRSLVPLSAHLFLPFPTPPLNSTAYTPTAPSPPPSPMSATAIDTWKLTSPTATIRNVSHAGRPCPAPILSNVTRTQLREGHARSR